MSLSNFINLADHPHQSPVLAVVGLVLSFPALVIDKSESLLETWLRIYLGCVLVWWLARQRKRFVPLAVYPPRLCFWKNNNLLATSSRADESHEMRSSPTSFSSVPDSSSASFNISCNGEEDEDDEEDDVLQCVSLLFQEENEEDDENDDSFDERRDSGTVVARILSKDDIAYENKKAHSCRRCDPMALRRSLEEETQQSLMVESENCRNSNWREPQSAPKDAVVFLEVDLRLSPETMGSPRDHNARTDSSTYRLFERFSTMLTWDRLAYADGEREKISFAK